jgi:hypothetical protein
MIELVIVACLAIDECKENRLTYAAGEISAARAQGLMPALASGSEPSTALESPPQSSEFPVALLALGISNWESKEPLQQKLLHQVQAWLAAEFGLPAIDGVPDISIVSLRKIAGLRYRDVSSDRWSSHPSEVLAVYDDEARTIYLPDGWTGRTAAELSVLVHETVHHLQNVGRLKFACPEEREKMAFEAQERWLQLFGSSLEADFELDPFTILARTNCLY